MTGEAPTRRDRLDNRSVQGCCHFGEREISQEFNHSFPVQKHNARERFSGRIKSAWAFADAKDARIK
jgi:hypothetical protein